MVRVARLALFGWIVASAIWAVFAVSTMWFPHGLDPTPPRDFDYYYVAARIGLTHGWNRVYDVDLQRSVYLSIQPTWEFTWATVFVSLPPMAWLAMPLALLSHQAAFWTWVGLTVAGYIGIGALTLPGSALARVAILLSGVWIHAVMIELQMGQNSLPVALAMVAAALLVERRHELAAGVLVGVGVALKPQVAMVVPLAMLVAGYWRTAIISGITGGVLASASALSLGAHGLTQLWSLLAMEQAHVDNQIWSPAILVGLGPAATLIQIGVMVVALGAAAVAGRAARMEPEGRIHLVVAAGLLGSLAAFSYHHESDWSVVVAVAWLWARAEPSRWLVPYLVAGGVLLAPIGLFGIQPAIAFTFASPAVMLVTSARWLPRLRRVSPAEAVA